MTVIGINDKIIQRRCVLFLPFVILHLITSKNLIKGATEPCRPLVKPNNQIPFQAFLKKNGWLTVFTKCPEHFCADYVFLELLQKTNKQTRKQQESKVKFATITINRKKYFKLNIHWETMDKTAAILLCSKLLNTFYSLNKMEGHCTFSSWITNWILCCELPQTQAVYAYLCVYMCICVFIYICMYPCKCICAFYVCMWMYVCVFVCANMCIYECTCSCMYPCKCICVCLFCLYYVSVCLCVNVYIWVHMHICIYTCMSICV